MGSKTTESGQPKSQLYLYFSNVQAGVEEEWENFDRTMKVDIVLAVSMIPSPPVEQKLRGGKKHFIKTPKGYFWLHFLFLDCLVIILLDQFN